MFLTQGYVDATIGTATRVAIAPNTAAFLVYEGQARAAVQAAAQVAGYSIGNTSSNDMVRLLAMSQWFHFGGGFRKGIAAPDPVREYFEKLDAVRDGKLPIPGLTPSTRDGIGGTKFSESSASSSEGRVQYFSRSKMTSW